MNASTRNLLSLLALAAFPAAGLAGGGGPADGLLPPPVRQAEKRSLGGDNDNIKRSYYDGRGGLGAAFSPDGKLLVTSQGYQGLTLWDVGAGRMLGPLSFPGGHNQNQVAVFTPDGKRLIATSWGGHQQAYPVHVWDVAKRERLRVLDDDVNDTPFTAVALAPGGKTIALAAGWGRRNEAGTVSLWDLASGDEVGRLTGLIKGPVQPAGPNFGAPLLQALAYSPDGRTLAVLVNGRVLLVEVAAGRVRDEIPFGSALEGRTDRPGMAVGALAFSPDGRTLAAGCPDGAVRRFDLRGGRELAPLPGHRGSVLALCWAPGGKRLQSYGMDGQSFAWRLNAGREWQPKEGPLSAAALQALWEILGEDDPRDLFGSVRTLAAAPGQTVPFLRKRLAPAPKADTQRIEELVVDLAKGDYNKRKRAVVALRKLGAAAAPALQRAMQRGLYDDLIRRLSLELANLAPPADQVRSVRAVRVLEAVGIAEARKLLEELAEGANESPLTVQARAALGRLGKPEAAKAEQTAEALWDALAGEDSAAAYRAIRALAHRPDTATLLRDRVKGVVGKDTFNDDPKRVARLIADLDSKAFPVRERATKALLNLGRLIVPTLRKALAAHEGLEIKRRLEKLLEEATKATPSPAILRIGRALEALELMGGPEARQALAALAEDEQPRWLREAVGESLRRQGEVKR
jgi:hypothetical protein